MNLIVKKILSNLISAVAVCSLFGGELYASDLFAKTALEIRTEALLPNISDIGKPLPLAGHWNAGYFAGGYTPDYQVKLIEKGHHVLPWFHLSMPGMPQRGVRYYAKAIKKISRYSIPISLLSTQWEILLTDSEKYFLLPAEINPNVILSDLTIKKKVSPFAQNDLWEEVGRQWVDTRYVRKLQNLYPSPPLVLFISNNEHPKLEWYESYSSKRFVDTYGYQVIDEDEIKRIFSNKWAEKYKILQKGIVSGLKKESWKRNSIFIGYNAFGGGAFGRWDGWSKYSINVPGEIDSKYRGWDGASSPYYVNNWDKSTDFTYISPQIQAMNWLIMLDEVYENKPNFWYEISTWDGHTKNKKDDKRRYYKQLGQDYGPTRYRGSIQYGMWLLRPRVVREYRSWTDTVVNSGMYFNQVLESVDYIYKNEVLKRFWRKGRLVVNDSYQHPYNKNLPARYKSIPRWYMLDSDLNDSKKVSLETEIKIFSLALELGSKPAREWLVYLFSPNYELLKTSLKLPGFGVADLVASKKGTFYHLVESRRSADRL